MNNLPNKTTSMPQNSPSTTSSQSSKRKIFNMIKLVIVWALAAFFLLIGTTARLRGSFNLGIGFLWAAGIFFALYGIFHKPIDAFCAHGIGRIIKYIFYIGLALYVALFLFVAFSGYIDAANGTEPVIVVLGAGLNKEKVSTVLRYRLDTALKLWEKDPNAVIVVTGGQGSDEIIPESLAMQRYLLEQGVPQDKIIMEDQSTSTEENLVFTKEILQNLGYPADTPIALVTNAFHCYRARQYALQAGFTEVHTSPAPMSLLYVVPSYSREIFAVLYYWVFKA